MKWNATVGMHVRNLYNFNIYDLLKLRDFRMAINAGDAIKVDFVCSNQNATPYNMLSCVKAMHNGLPRMLELDRAMKVMTIK